jgi:hypothetical protein
MSNEDCVLSYIYIYIYIHCPETNARDSKDLLFYSDKKKSHLIQISAAYYESTSLYSILEHHICSKVAAFWVVATCSLVEVYQRFRGPCCLHHQGDESASDSKDL